MTSRLNIVVNTPTMAVTNVVDRVVDEQWTDRAPRLVHTSTACHPALSRTSDRCAVLGFAEREQGVRDLPTVFTAPTDLYYQQDLIL